MRRDDRYILEKMHLQQASRQFFGKGRTITVYSNNPPHEVREALRVLQAVIAANGGQR